MGRLVSCSVPALQLDQPVDRASIRFQRFQATRLSGNTPLENALQSGCDAQSASAYSFVEKLEAINSGKPRRHPCDPLAHLVNPCFQMIS